MAKLDRRAAWLLFGILTMMAVLSFGQGLVHALSAPRPEQPAAGVDPSRDPIPRASALTGPVLDEARVREIAREEATAAAAVVRKRAAPPPPKAEPRDVDAAAPMTTAGTPSTAAATTTRPTGSTTPAATSLTPRAAPSPIFGPPGAASRAGAPPGAAPPTPPF